MNNDKPNKETQLSLKEERFSLAQANGADKYKSLDIAGYEAKTRNSRAVQVSKLLKREDIRHRILDLQTEVMLAHGLTDERILGNVAQIAFNKAGNKQDRLRALELLGKERAMWKDNQVGRADTEPKALTDAERARLKLMSKNLLTDTAESA